jgi:hypothetical protein
MGRNTWDAKVVKPSVGMYDCVMVQMKPLVVHMLQVEINTRDVKMVNVSTEMDPWVVMPFLVEQMIMKTWMTGTLPQMGLDLEMTSTISVAHHWMIVKLVTQQ